MSSAASRRRNAIRLGALTLGLVLFAATLSYIDFGIALGEIRRLGVALPVALVFSGLWHLARTWAWAWCFPQPRRVGFMRLLRVRLSAEAFSYLTLRGIAGEPLKVVLLSDRVDARAATAAVALERIAYLVGTTIIIGIASIAAIATLPLSRVWFRVFRGFAIAAAILASLAVIVLAGRGTYLGSLLRRIDAALGTQISDGRVSRFVSGVEGQMLELVRGNPRRLAVLLFTTALSYVFMALEAWIILRGAGAPVSPTAAFTVETFSRVASFASAFIPANLGALEASSLAAVAAVGAAGGGAALGLARRIRGLFWAGVGLAIYPRRLRPARPADSDATIDRQTPAAPRSRPTLLYFPSDDGVDVSPAARLAGLPIAERVLRAAWRAGYGCAIVRADSDTPAFRRLEAAIRDAGGDVRIATTATEWDDALRNVPSSDELTAIGAGTVVSPALLQAAATMSSGADEVADVPASLTAPESGVIRVAASRASHAEWVQAQLAARRMRALPLPSGQDVADGRACLAIRIVDPGDLPAAEATIRRASYKETDSRIARFNRRISIPISIALLRTPLTANQLSVILVALGLYSAWLFSLGRYWTGVLAAGLSLTASILDGCDGEIARLKYQESALGCWIETIGDYAYYVAIFIGLSVGVVRQTQVEAFYWIGALALAGTLLSFALLILLRSRITGGQPEKLHAVARDRFHADRSWLARAIWRVSFVATRAAMPYGIVAFALLDKLPGIVVLAAVGANIYWISLAVKWRSLLGEPAAVARSFSSASASMPRR